MVLLFRTIVKTLITHTHTYTHTHTVCVLYYIYCTIYGVFVALHTSGEQETVFYHILCATAGIKLGLQAFLASAL